MLSALKESEKTWISEQIEAEAERIRSYGTKCLPLTVNNVCRVSHTEVAPVRRTFVFNRLELQTQFDFDRVLQILISPPTPLPFKEGWEYVCLVLTTDNTSIVLLAPFIYEKGAGQLDRWEFVNSLGQISRQVVKNYETITDQ